MMNEYTKTMEVVLHWGTIPISLWGFQMMELLTFSWKWVPGAGITDLLLEVDGAALEHYSHELVGVPGDGVGPFHSGHLVTSFLAQQNSAAPGSL